MSISPVSRDGRITRNSVKQQPKKKKKFRECQIDKV